MRDYELSPTYRRGIRRRRRRRPGGYSVGQATKKKTAPAERKRWPWLVIGALSGVVAVGYFWWRHELETAHGRDNPGDDPPGNPGRWERSEVQSLLFDRDYWTEKQATRWARDHGYVSSYVDATDAYYRIRQFDPSAGGPFRTIEFQPGLKAIVSAA